MKKAISVFLIILFILSLCGCHEKREYYEWQLDYMLDNDYVNKDKFNNHPDYSTLVYFYVFEEAGAKNGSDGQSSVEFFINYKEGIFYLDSHSLLRSEYMRADPIFKTSLTDELKMKCKRIITNANMETWKKTYSRIGYGYMWDVAMEFENGSIYRFTGSDWEKKPDGFDDFLLQWYLLVDGLDPGIFDNTLMMNTRVYDKWAYETYGENEWTGGPNYPDRQTDESADDVA